MHRIFLFLMLSSAFAAFGNPSKDSKGDSTKGGSLCAPMIDQHCKEHQQSKNNCILWPFCPGVLSVGDKPQEHQGTPFEVCAHAMMKGVSCQSDNGSKACDPSQCDCKGSATASSGGKPADGKASGGKPDTSKPASGKPDKSSGGKPATSTGKPDKSSGKPDKSKKSSGSGKDKDKKDDKDKKGKANDKDKNDKDKKDKDKKDKDKKDKGKHSMFLALQNRKKPAGGASDKSGSDKSSKGDGNEEQYMVIYHACASKYGFKLESWLPDKTHAMQIWFNQKYKDHSLPPASLSYMAKYCPNGFKPMTTKGSLNAICRYYTQQAVACEAIHGKKSPKVSAQQLPSFVAAACGDVSTTIQSPI